jgi:hypothetical protein
LTGNLPEQETDPMSEPTQPPGTGNEGTTHEIPGWDRPAWALRGVRDRDELTWTREASQDVTYLAGGVEETFAPSLLRTDQVSIGEDGAAVHVGQTVIHHAEDYTIVPAEARKLAEALTELADYAEPETEGRDIVTT